MSATAIRSPDESRLVVMAERYFAAVDRMDLSDTLACFAPDARFTIATYNTVYQDRDTEIRSLPRAGSSSFMPLRHTPSLIGSELGRWVLSALSPCSQDQVDGALGAAA